MAYYITYGEFQQHMKDYFFRTGSRMQFPEMADYLYRKGLLSETPPDPMLTSECSETWTTMRSIRSSINFLWN